MTKGRLEAFSDAVFAIAITLLVIELRPPALGDGQRLFEALWQQWPSYLAYLVSFLSIAVVWLNHHWIFEQVVPVDGPLLVLNLHLLLWAPLALAVCGAMALNHGRHHLRRRPGSVPAEGTGRAAAVSFLAAVSSVQDPRP